MGRRRMRGCRASFRKDSLCGPPTYNANMESSVLPLHEAFARQFAQEWIEAWNGHDLERVLEHYDDEVVLISPVALKVFGGELVQGKAALREYFRRGLEAFPNLRFDFFDVLWGIETIVVVYENNVRNSKAAEVMELSASGKVTRVWANYDR